MRTGREKEKNFMEEIKDRQMKVPEVKLKHKSKKSEYGTGILSKKR